MPLYVFQIQDGLGSRDRVSLHLDGPEQARAEAAVAAGEMLRDADGRFWDAPEWRVQVTDAHGALVGTLVISGATSGPPPRDGPA